MLLFGTKARDVFKAWTKADKEAQIEGTKRLGLPENNTAADRAKAMGFDLDNPEYHTTNLDGKLGIEADGFTNIEKQKNFQLLDNPKAPERDRYLTLDDAEFDADGNVIGMSNDSLRSYYNKGNYTSNKPFSAEMTSQVDALEPKFTFPLVINKSKHFDYNNPEHVKDLMTPRPDESTWSKMYPDSFGSGEVNPLDLERIQKGQHNVMEDFITQMNIKKRGYTGTNMKEPKDWDYSDATTTVSFQPEVYRSPLAHFNPKYAGVGAGSVLSADLMAGENNTKPTENIWSSLMNTIGNVNQQQAQGAADIGAGAMEGTAGLAKMLATQPDVVAEIAGGGLLKTAGVVSPWIKGAGLGGVLYPSELQDGTLRDESGEYHPHVAQMLKQKQLDEYIASLTPDIHSTEIKLGR